MEGSRVLGYRVQGSGLQDLGLKVSGGPRELLVWWFTVLGFRPCVRIRI